MQFNVPGAVLSQIAAYDPQATKPKPVAAPNPDRPTRNTLGVVNDLFPTSLVDAETQQRWALTMNQLDNADRYFTLNNDQVHAVLYVHRGFWCGYWRPKAADSEYLFGLSIAYKSSPSSLKKVGTLPIRAENPDFRTLDQIAPPTDVKYGRVSMRKHTATVTETDIINWRLNTIPTFNILRGSWATIRHKEEEIESLIEGFKEKILFWRSKFSIRSAFSRILDNADPISYVKRSGIVVPNNSDFNYKAKTLPELAKLFYPNIEKILSTPYFVKESASVLSKISDLISDKEIFSDAPVEDWAKNYFLRCSRLSAFVYIYGDENADYCQQVWESGKFSFDYHRGRLYNLYSEYKGVFDWFRQNVPVASFVNMMRGEEADDTLGMMKTMWLRVNNLSRYQNVKDDMPNPLALSRPKRWRITDLHDLVSEEVYKMENPNMDLPQDLFPQPVKTGSYTFFQPTDTHQLAKWGRAVRNCVGSSSHYADQVKNKRQFIVLALENGQPRFTIQLKVEGGVMTVVQIVGMCNRRLTDVEKDSYTKAFGEALKIRERELARA